MSSARSNDASTSKGGFLSGSGDGRLQKSLLVKNEAPLPASTSSLVEKLKRFLPDMEKANADLVYGQNVAAIEVIPAGDSDEEEEEETLEPRIEMNISLFPIEGEGDDEDDHETTVETDGQQRQKRSRPVEEIKDKKEGA